MRLLRHWPIFLPFALALGVFRAWFSPGLLLGDDQFRFSHDQLASYFPWRNAWDPSVVFGVPSGDASPAYPLWAAAGALTHIGAGYELVERLIWFWPLYLCLVLAPYAFIYRLTRAPWAASLAGAIFAINTWTISLVQRGHIPSLVAYALMPFAVLAWLVLLRQRTPVKAVQFAALLTLQVMYDIRYAYITAIACLIAAAVSGMRAAARRRPVAARSAVVAGAWVALALVAFNAYWMLPLAVAPAHLPAGYATLLYFESASQSQTLGHALALFYPFYHYVQGGDPFAPSPIEPAFFIVFAFAVLAALAARRRWMAVALALSAAVGIILTSGPQSFFGAFDEFVFAHVPGMQLFRDISKFSALVAFAYASLVGIGFARLAAATRNRVGRPARAIVALLACVAVGCYALLMRDAFNPMRFSNFATTTLSRDDLAVQSFLDGQPGYFRTVLFPMWQPELVGTAMHPVVSADYLVNSAAADGGLGDFFPTYATQLVRFASPVLPALLAEASVRYVIVDDDPRRILYQPFEFRVTHAESVAFFRARPWLREVERFGGYVVFKLTPPLAPRAFFAASPVTIAGPPTNLAALVGHPDWGKLPAAVIVDSRSGSDAQPAFVTDAASGAETVTGTFALATAQRMRAWVTASPSDVLARSAAHAQMRNTNELVPSSIPTLPTLPGFPVSFEIDDPRILSAPYAYPPAGAQWRGIVGPAADVEITNWSEKALKADVVIPSVFSPDGAQRVVTVADETHHAHSFVIAGTAFGDVSPTQLLVPDVTLDPGPNVIHLAVGTRTSGNPSAADAYSLIFADDISITSVSTVTAGPDERPLRAIVSPSASGLDVVARLAPGDAPYGHAAFTIFRSLAIPLARMPAISVEYVPPVGPARLALYAGVRRRADGARTEFVHPLPSTKYADTVDLFPAMQAVFDGTASNAPAGVEDASGYDLVAVTVVMVASAARAAAGTGDRQREFRARIVDARIDERAAAYAPVPDVRYADLRSTAVLGIARATRSPRLLRVSSGGHRAMSSATIDVPLADSGAASQLVFWLRMPSDVVPAVELSFTPPGGRNPVVVPARGRPSSAGAPDRMPAAWVQTLAHVVEGATGDWRRYAIDLTDVRAFGLPNGGAQYSLTAMRIAVHTQGTLPSVDLSDVALITPPDKTVRTTDPRPVQRVVIDGREFPLEWWRRDSMTNRYVDASDPIALHQGDHRISVEPPLPLQISSIYLAGDARMSSSAGTVREFSALSPSEYSLSIHGGGLLVWPMSFAPGWQAYQVNDQDAMPTGRALIDVWRLRAHRVPADAHVTVNGIFNGWRLAPNGQRVVLLYVPEAASEFGGLAWILLSVAVVITALLVARARP